MNTYSRMRHNALQFTVISAERARKNAALLCAAFTSALPLYRSANYAQPFLNIRFRFLALRFGVQPLADVLTDRGQPIIGDMLRVVLGHAAVAMAHHVVSGRLVSRGPADGPVNVAK